MNYLNEFTCEFWRGNDDRRLAPDYVTRCPLESFHAPLRFAGRINGQVTTDQGALKQLRAEIVATVFAKGQV